MIQVLLLTRGALAEEWLRATAEVRGCPASGVEALVLDWNSTCEVDRAHVHTAVQTLQTAGPVIVLTDLHGSTQSNLAAELAAGEDVAVVAGANLGMVLRLACDPRTDRSLGELTEWICAKGRASITEILPSGSSK